MAAVTDIAQTGEPFERGVLVLAGRTLQWHEAGYGEYVDGLVHAFASREIVAIAGSAELGAASSASPWEGMRDVASRLLAGAAFLPGCDALEVRYLASPRPGQQTRLRMFVTAKSLTGAVGTAQAVVESACAALPAGFTWEVPAVGPAVGSRGWGGDTVVELHRHEEITQPQWNFVPTAFYYTINDEPGDSSGWPQFWQLLARVAQPVEISLLFRATDLDPRERDTLARITSDLTLYGNPHSDYDVFGNPVHYPADANAAVALDRWTKRIGHLQRPLLGRVAVRGGPDVAYSVATALAAAIGASSSAGEPAHPMYIEAPDVSSPEEKLAFEAFDWLEVFPWGGIRLWEMDEAPRMLRRLPYLYGLGEAAGLAVLPVPDDQGVPGFQRAARTAARRAAVGVADQSGPGVLLGDLLHEGARAGNVDLPLAAVNRHVLIAGAPGSGKTTTVLSLLTRLWIEHGIPFLAFEPVKREYRTLLGVPGIEDLRIVTLGRDDVAPFRLNPLCPPPGVRREVHAAAVMASLKAALPLPAPLPQLLEESLERCYVLAGWDYDTAPEAGVRPPTLRDLLASFDAVFASYEYTGEARNIAAAGRVRLTSLLRGSRGRLLDTVESADVEELMARPTVLELDEIGDPEDKAVITAFLLDRLRASASARGSTGGQLRHVTVLEEAHQLLAKRDEGTSTGEAGGARAAGVAALCDAIATMRSLGEGFVISSQSPSALADAAVANTGTRILHRLESSADRQVMLDDFDAGPVEREGAARLEVGQALARWPQVQEPELLHVQAAPGVDSGRAVADSTVGAAMSNARDDILALLPYALCTRTVCSGGCDPARRSGGHRVSLEVGPAARRAWTDDGGAVESLGPISALLARAGKGDSALSYCGAVHLAVNGDALQSGHPDDVRSALIEAIHGARDHDA